MWPRSPRRPQARPGSPVTVEVVVDACPPDVEWPDLHSQLDEILGFIFEIERRERPFWSPGR